VIVRNAGSVEASASAVRDLENEGVLAILGPFADAFQAALAARQGALPLLSPEPRTPPGGPAGYAFGLPDPEAARTLARFAESTGLLQVVILHSTDAVSAAEAETFAEALEALGGSVLRRISYAPGSTSFTSALEQARNLRPQALVLPMPAADIVLLAPQLATAGLRALGIRILGTAAWTDQGALTAVASRHTDGVVAVSPDLPDRVTEARRQFDDVMSQRDGDVPDLTAALLGYDAASLVLLALASGARTPAEVGRALDQVRDFPGASGTLSVTGGQILREHHVVCIQEQRPVLCQGDG
jgi:ABC-type branched-subunit amino acid transport system substrate-binding protein